MKKAVYALAVGVLFMGAGCGATTPSGTMGDASGGTKTYKNELYSFEFNYPAGGKESTPLYANLDDQFVQVDLPTEGYGSTNLSEAQFVASGLPLGELNDCLTLGLPDDSVEFNDTKTINGIEYHVADFTDDSSETNVRESKLYRTFQDYECFEFEETINTYKDSDQPAVDKNAVWQSLENIMNTVKFTQVNNS